MSIQSLLHEKFIRGRTHVETVYLTLLEHALSRNLPPDVFIDYFITYIYKSVVIPEVIRDKTGELNRHFRTLVDRAFRQTLGHKFELTPDFVNDIKDPLTICEEFLAQNASKLFTPEELRRSDWRGTIRKICNEIIYKASMAFLKSLDLIR